MRRSLKLASVLGGLLWAVGTLDAAPITYTEQVSGTGSLGSSTFTNALVTITFTGDTENVFTPIFGVLANSAGAAVVSVFGVGEESFTDSVAVFITPTNNGAGIADFTANSDVLDIVNTSFATYDLRTGIGPLSGRSIIFPARTFNTTGGAFHLTSAVASAIFGASIVPEPSSGTFICLGITVIGICRWKRRHCAQ